MASLQPKQTLRNLEKTVELRGKLLPMLKTLECLDLMMIIGAAEERGQPVGYKQLLLENLSPPSTLKRRIDRLIRNKVIRKVNAMEDGRRVEYVLSNASARLLKAVFSASCEDLRRQTHA